MVKLIDKQNIFNSGIISTKLYSRDDLKQYNNGVYDAFNFICSRYGPIEKRVGTNFIWDLGNPDEQVFFLPFIFNIRQSILLEFLDKKIRFYTFNGKDFGPIADPNNPTQQYTIDTPFTADKLEGISYTQSLDVVYLAFADGKTPPYTLSRYANNNWKLEQFETEDGPYLDKNYDQSKTVRITDLSANSSHVSLKGFSLSHADVGRWIRICTPRYNENTYEYEDKWSYGRIYEVWSENSIDVKWSYRNEVQDTDKSWMMAETSEFRLGVWHSGTGSSDFPVTYPTKVTIHQQRLAWAGMTDKPWIWLSNSFAYKNYAPMDYEGTIKDSHAISADISSDQVSEIFWIKSVKHLLIGTELCEMRLGSAGMAVTPSDIAAPRETSYGSNNSEPIVFDDNIIFIQRLQRTVRSLSYDYNQDSYIGPELTILAENLTAGGIKKIVYQKEPNNTFWCLKNNGELLTLTYDKTQEVMGWSRSKIAGTDAKVIDLSVLPSYTYQQDMVLMAVERTVNGEKKRYLELLSQNFTDDVAHKDAVFLDCAVHIKADEEFDVIDGLDFLEGETVHVTDEGATEDEYVVIDGRIELNSLCKNIVVGIPYQAYFETLERDFQDKQISTKVSKLRVYKLKLYLDRTLGITIRRLEHGSNTVLATFDPTANTDTTPELLTGKVDIKVASSWDNEYRLRIDSHPGLPCTVSGITIGVEVNAL